jgi:probable F420-dependent oxidoreductase
LLRFALADAMCDPSHYAPLARAAEDAGFDSFPVGDSICYPEVAVGKYPYTADGDRRFLDGAPFIDPFQLIASLAATTQRLRFAIGVLKLPIRQPVLVAKAASSLAYLTGNRLALGVGLSPWIEDFQVCGADWRTRARRMDQMIAIIRGLMRGEYFEYHSEFYDIPRIKLCPVPSEPLPILIGGHSEAALRRAARLADGFMFTGVTREELARHLAQLASYRREHGRDRLPFEIWAGVSDARGPDDYRRLEDLGVTDVVVGPRNPYQPDTMALRDKLDFARRFADGVIAKLR